MLEIFNTNILIDTSKVPNVLKKGDLVLYKNVMLYFEREEWPYYYFTNPISGKEVKYKINKIREYGKY